jgi:hypothetical protein
VVEYLRKAIDGMNMALVFVYCDYQDQAIQTIISIMGSLATQLVSQARFIPWQVWKMHKPIDVEAAQAIIKLVLEQFDHVYICFDALDELQPDVRRQLLEFLKTVSGTSLRLFVTGRPNVESELDSSLAEKATSKIPIVANVEDMELYFAQRLSHDLHPEAMDETLRDQIKEKIIQWSQGM